MTGISTKKTVRAFLLGSVAFGLAAPAAAESGSLEQQLRDLQQEVQQLKEQQERDRVAAPANAVTGGDIPGSFKLPGTDTSVAIGGYAKGDVIMSLDQDLGPTFTVGAIQPDGAQENTEFRLQGVQSRVNLTTHTPTQFGTARTFVEGDFYPTGSAFRLRHAYGELGGFLAGQTWSLFVPLSTYPDTVDFHGPVGISAQRQGQVRYTHSMGPGLSLAVSAENPTFSFTEQDEEDLVSDAGVNQVPDFHGALQYDEGGIHFRGAGFVRYLKADAPGIDDSEWGWGVMGSGALEAMPGTTIMGNILYGEGMGRYNYGVFDGITPNEAVVDAEGNLSAVEQWAASAALSHSWTPEVTSNLVYGHLKIRDTFIDNQIDNLHTFHVNTWWSPVAQARFGLEYMHGRKNFADSDLDNSANRVQFGAQYFF